MNIQIELFHIPPSFYSQIARLALEKVGLSWVDKWIIAGPPTNENYRPRYMRLNPSGTVPTLRVVTGTKTLMLTDSMGVPEL